MAFVGPEFVGGPGEQVGLEGFGGPGRNWWAWRASVSLEGVGGSGEQVGLKGVSWPGGRRWAWRVGGPGVNVKKKKDTSATRLVLAYKMSLEGSVSIYLVYLSVLSIFLSHYLY